jgi:hypothetical protein
VLDKSLKDSNPTLYAHILEFARTNKLKICGDEDDTTPPDATDNKTA